MSGKWEQVQQKKNISEKKFLKSLQRICSIFQPIFYFKSQFDSLFQNWYISPIMSSAIVYFTSHFTRLYLTYFYNKSSAIFHISLDYILHVSTICLLLFSILNPISLHYILPHLHAAALNRRITWLLHWRNCKKVVQFRSIL